MIGYLDARKKLLGLRKARGFKDPSTSDVPGSSKPSGSQYRGRERHEDRREEGRGRPASTTQRPDFSWKDRDRGHGGHQGGRRKTPPPRKKGAGKGKHKGRSTRSNSQPRRNDPSGSQYLGMAISGSPAPTSFRGSPAPTSFRPEFSFMAMAHEDSATSSPSDRIPHRPSAECGYVSRQALASVEKFIEDCLVLDRYLGLEGTAGSAPGVLNSMQSSSLTIYSFKPDI